MLTQIRINKTGTALFKPEAPNDMKNEDLIAKLRIITEPSHRIANPCELAPRSIDRFLVESSSLHRRSAFRSRMRRAMLILYPQHLYVC